MFTYLFSTTLDAAGRTLTSSDSFSYSTRYEADVVVNAGTTDQLHTLTLDVSEIRFLALVSNVDLKIETNSATSPASTINLKAGKQLSYDSQGYFANPLSADVTAFYLTNTGTAQATLKIRVLMAP